LLAITGVLTTLIAMQEPKGTSIETRADLKSIYDAFKVDGSFILYDQNFDKIINYNPGQLKIPFTPASTFKIANSIIAIETGVIASDTVVLKWDSVARQNLAWNKDQDMNTAFHNSTVWYYQEVARRIGEKRMKEWLVKLNYGNADISGGIDKFWLTGGLRITPEQQLDFLRRFYTNRLPISLRTKELVQKIMIMEELSDYRLSTKTGWGMQDGQNVGWYIGYLEFKGKVYYFVNCIQSNEFNNPDFARARVDIVRQIFTKLNITR